MKVQIDTTQFKQPKSYMFIAGNPDLRYMITRKRPWFFRRFFWWVLLGVKWRNVDERI